MSTYPIVDWMKCYGEGWTPDDIHPEAFRHPAKFSKALIRRIYEYLLENNFVKPSDTILDPFGGVGLGGLMAARFGLRWVGVELEPDFVVLSHRNFEKLCRKEWCVCDEQGQRYVRSMRESLSKRIGRGEQEAQIEERPVLQSGMQELFSLQGSEVERGESKEVEGAQAVESGQATLKSDSSKDKRKGKAKSRRKESELEGREVYTPGRIHRDTSERALQDGARSPDGASDRPSDDARGGGASQERQTARQPNRELTGDDHIGTHEAPSPTRSQKEKFCPRCGKLRVYFPIQLQGDSRRIGEVVRGAGGIVSSPPFNEVLNGGKGNSGINFDLLNGTRWANGPEEYGSSPGQLGAMASGDVNAILSSPPYIDSMNSEGHGIDWDKVKKDYPGREMHDERKEMMNRNHDELNYGVTEGQLGSMPPGDVNAIIASPPFGSHDSAGPESLHTRTDESAKAMLTAQGWNGGGQVSEDNLATLPEDDFDAVISSPPFIQTSGGTNVTSPDGPLADPSLISRHSAGNAAAHGYGESEGQLQSMPEGDVNAIISSPPFHSTVGGGGDQLQYVKGGLLPNENRRGKVGVGGSHDYGEAAGQMQAMKEGDVNAIISSPPFVQSEGGSVMIPPHASKGHQLYGVGTQSTVDSEGQLGALPEGDIDAIIASPPFVGVEGSNSANKYADPEKTAEDMARKYEDGTFKGHKASKEAILKSLTRENEWNYGHTPGQLANAPEGRFESVVSSPPFENTDPAHNLNAHNANKFSHVGSVQKQLGEYGQSDGQLGNDSGDTFWSAALTIVTECYKLLAPGSVAVWICKDYVRNKKRVPFSDQWRQLCEKVGFVTLTEVHAWVVEDNGTQLGMLETEDKHHKTERKSFFRRLAEKKGSPRIDWETVWIMRK